MDSTVSTADREFRDEVRTWLRAHVPAEPQPSDLRAMRGYDSAWQRAQFEAGWAGIAWPVEYGGRGLSPVQQLIWHEEHSLAGGLDAGTNFVGLNHGGPTLIARGSDAQKAAYLPRILRGDAVWCQGPPNRARAQTSPRSALAPRSTATTS